MDTTSHTVSWQTFALGDPASSVLYDVAIINDTLVYAVGEIYLRDSTGQLDPLLYNLAVWNGTMWDIRRLGYKNAIGVFYNRIEWIFALNADDIWFANSVHWDGKAYNSVDIGSSVFTGIGSTKMWGASGGQLYVVGNSGTIAYSPDHGASWQRLTSGTTLNFHDIWGATNPNTGQQEILAVASDPFGTHEKTIVQISGTTVATISDSGIVEPISTVWFMSGRRYYVAGSGLTSPLWHKRTLSEARWTNDVIPSFQYYVFSIRGTDVNDLFTCSGEFLHFNGFSWMKYPGITSGETYVSIAVKGKLTVAVGNGRGGRIALGRR